MDFNQLKKNCSLLEQEHSLIPDERKTKLQDLSEYLIGKFVKKERPKLVVICTHNSRRSHLGQIWLAVAADYYSLPAMETYSGGTEGTAFNPRVVAALKRISFEIVQEGVHNPGNPYYHVQWRPDQEPYIAFSKRFDEAPNPGRDFAAIMVCTEADEACPFVPGADFRLALPYSDPKAFDGTELEREKYDERCRQIGRELFFCMRETKLKLQTNN